MSRLRIRSMKPEAGQDERLGRCTRDARLLFWNLIQMADDEGRLRAQPEIIVGHGFAYDGDALRKLPRWLGELEEIGAILRYTVNGSPYITLRNWSRHQKINRPLPSLLPPSPDREVVIRNSIVDGHQWREEDGTSHVPLTEDSVSPHGGVTNGSQPRAQARGSRSLIPLLDPNDSTKGNVGVGSALHAQGGTR